MPLNPLNMPSAMFKSFLESIGCFVDLSCSDDKYTGKLDCNRFSNGKYSLRFFTQRFDVMYHVAPMMPTESDDAQQLRKKRHIGNDHVHIVWSEDSKDYDPTTIVSNFNDAHIVIYPLSDDLFRKQKFIHCLEIALSQRTHWVFWFNGLPFLPTDPCPQMKWDKLVNLKSR